MDVVVGVLVLALEGFLTEGIPTLSFRGQLFHHPREMLGIEPGLAVPELLFSHELCVRAGREV